MGSFFIDRHQVLQKEIDRGRIIRQNQVFLNAFAEFFEKASKETLAKESTNVNQPKNKGRPWSFIEFGVLTLQHLLNRFESWSSLKTVVDLSNEELVDVVVVVLPCLGPSVCMSHFSILRLILSGLSGGMLRLFSKFFCLVFSLGWAYTFWALSCLQQVLLDPEWWWDDAYVFW